MGASQFLIVDPEGEATAQRVKEDLGETVSVVRATSPIDHSTGWIEIFPPATDKGSGVDYLAKRFGLAAEECAAVGNDYNDLHMLEWVHWPYVVADAPDELRRRFRVVGPCAEGGAAEAVVFWLAGMEEKESGRRAKGAESREAAE